MNNRYNKIQFVFHLVSFIDQIVAFKIAFISANPFNSNYFFLLFFYLYLWLILYLICEVKPWDINEHSADEKDLYLKLTVILFPSAHCVCPFLVLHCNLARK